MRCRIVMAGLDPAIHVLARGTKNVDARDKPGHDGLSLYECTKKKSRLCDKRPKSREETPEHNPNRIAAKERSRKALAYP